MPGFGDGPFGRGYFGEWQWSLAAIVEGIPAVYQEQDELSGAGTLRAMLEGLVPSLDGLRQKVRDYDDLRDPLKAPTDRNFNEEVLIIRTDNLDDGTSRVFLSEGPDGDKYVGIRPGMVLIDLTGNRFTISAVHSSALPSDVDDPPIDPATGEETGRHVIVENIGASSTELIPFSSSTLINDEDPDTVPAVGTITAVAEALLVDGVDTFTLSDGVNPPVVFEFDTTPDGVAPGNVQINTSGLVTAVDVANAIVEAINTTPNLNLDASNGGGTSAVVTINNTVAGTAGNGALWSESVTDPGFVIVQPSGGAIGAFPLEAGVDRGVDDGIGLAPYVFNLTASYVGGLQLAPNRILIRWTESGVQKSGFFTADDLPGGDLADTSTINRASTVPVLAAGQIRLYNDSGAPIDPDSIKVTYTYIPVTQTEDAEIRSQNILAFLASDYGIKLDRNDPEVLQRSYVNNAFKIWDIKGTELGYFVLGKYAGYFVSANALYSISNEVAAGLPPAFLFAFPTGTTASGSIAAIPAASIIDGETFTLDDGVNSPTIFEFDTNSSVAFGNVAVDISAAITAIDVATAMVSAINGVGGSLNLTSGNNAGSSSIVTIVNGQIGVIGNVTTWSDTVLDSGFAITQPTGGTDSNWFTTINPGRGQFDEIALDIIPLDTLCSDASYPSIVQVVNATLVEFVQQEGSRIRSRVTVTTAAMYESFATDGVFTDSMAQVFDVENFARVDATTYTFEVSSIVTPTAGAGSVEWSVLEFSTTITGLGDVADLGVQYKGYLGHRYRITKTFIDPPVSGTGNWAFIDSTGVISYLESFQHVSGTTYQFDIISATAPAVGSAHIFYYCEIVTSCDFCRASSILVRISPDEILNFPESLEGDALSRLIIRLGQMVPGHIRIAAFLYDPGPAIASWSIAASSFVSEIPTDDSLYTAIYDEDEYPADEIPTDSAAIIASSDVTITNLNILEEFLLPGVVDPLVLGTWTATGLWHTTQYDYASTYKSFNFGQGDTITTAPNYDTGGITLGVLTSPSMTIPTASQVILRFRHYGLMRPGGVDDQVDVRIVSDVLAFGTIAYGKIALGLDGTGTNGGFTVFQTGIGGTVIGAGSFHIEFVFASNTNTTGVTGEGWYVDDIEIKVIP